MTKEERQAWNKAYYEANKEHLAARRKARYEANKQHVLEQHKKYRSENSTSVLEYQKQYYAENKERISKRNKEYRESRREVFLQRSKNYYASHSDKWAMKSRNRYYGLKNRTPQWADSEKIRAIYLDAAEFRAAGLNVHVDHIYPIQGKKVSGLHVHDNLTIKLAEWNLSKGNRCEPVL